MFRRGDYRPFVRASIDAFEQLQSVTSAEIALAVPYINITQIHPFTGEVVNSDIVKEMLAVPPYGNVLGAAFPERPLISLGSLEVKTEQQYGYAYNSVVTMEFVVHQPGVVFSADEYSAWRELLVEGNTFLLEYGWASNPRTLSNDLLNGVGFYDRSSGLLVQSRTRMLVATVKYNISAEVNGALRVNMEMRTMGNIGLRQVSLFQELVEEFVEEEAIPPGGLSPLAALKRVATSIVGPAEERVIQAVQARLTSLDKTKGFEKGRRRFIRLGDVLDSFVAPIIERMAERLGYVRADLFLGNFNKRAGKTSEDMGSEELSGRSIGDFPIPVDLLRSSLSDMRLKGRLLRVESLVETLLNLTRGPARWSETSRRVPSVFPISRDVPERGQSSTAPAGSAFLYAIADAYDGSEALESDADTIPAESITKQRVFEKLSERGIPVIELGRADSILKGFNFEVSPEPLQRSIFAERQLQARKDQVQMVEQPDPRGLAGRANSSHVIPLTTMNGSLQMVGNFVFQLFSYVWIEFYGAYPISGVYNMRERVDRIEPGNFTTTLGLISEGLDPFNTRRRLSASQLAEERRIAAERQAKIEDEARRKRQR